MIRKLFILALVLSPITIIEPTSAAPVTWGSAFELVSDSDIDVSFGPVVYAVNGGDNIGNEDFIPDPNVIPDPLVVTVGGTQIPFEGVETVYGLDASFGMLGFPFETFGDATDHLPGDGSNVDFTVTNERTVAIPQVSFDPAPATLFDPLETGNYLTTTGNSDLDSLLDSQVFMDSRASLGAGFVPDPNQPLQQFAGTLTIKLNNLTPGTNYQIQVIGGGDDEDVVSNPMTIDPNFDPTNTGKDIGAIATLTDNDGNAVEDLGGALDLDGDNVGHVTTAIGTFTADGASQTLHYILQRGRNVGFSGLILTEEAILVDSADFDGDGDIDGVDFMTLQQGFGTGTTHAEGDANHNGSIDSADLAIWESQYGSPAPLAAISSVPEPSTAIIAGACFLVCCSVLRTKRSSDC